ncbi:MAG: NAD(P)-dependent alcohol dehydrogenase [Bacteroidota bacterium]
MKAIICTRYGAPEVLQNKELPKPVPKAGEVLIKTIATSAHIGDTRIRRADPFLVRLVFGLFKPRKNLILGIEMSGIVEAVGSQVDVDDFKVGDEVCGLNGFGLGAYAEYCCVPARPKAGKSERQGLITRKPQNLSFGEAATLPSGALTALKNLQKAKLSPGQSILINGASGSLGTYAIQLAKYFGARITAVCSGKNEALVRSLGAEKVIDYTKEDFTQAEEQYDVIYDAVMKSSARACRAILKPEGIFVRNTRLPSIEPPDLDLLVDLVEAGTIKPVIDRSYAWSEVVEAHRYVDQGHKKGNVIMEVQAP